MREKRAEKRAKRVKAVNRALVKYQKDKAPGDCREYVEVETNVTIETPTRWGEKGWIRAPV